MEDAAYKAWLADTNSGRTSLLIAADNTTVARLNARARLDRIVTGQVEPDGIELHNGNHAGLGDHIVTRLNHRRLRYGKTSFVQNGDRWTVVHRWPDGSLTVQNHTGDTVTLPSTYVVESVELAYATTAHRAQGATVDTAHVLVTDQLNRALLYVGMTRGRHTNNAYVATHRAASDLHETDPEQTMQDVLEAVLNDPGVEQSAHEILRRELDKATRLDRLVPIHEHLCQLDGRTRYQEAIATSGLDATDQTALQAAPAYGAFIAELRRAEDAELNLSEIVCQAVGQSSMATADDLAAVLHARVERLVSRAIRRTGHQPTLIAGLVSPASKLADPTLLAPLRELESQIIQRASLLAEKAAAEGPSWYRSVHAAGDEGLVREVAAYRERYEVRSEAALGESPRHDLVRRHHHVRLVSSLRKTKHTSQGDAHAVEPHENVTDQSFVDGPPTNTPLQPTHLRGVDNP